MWAPWSVSHRRITLLQEGANVSPSVLAHLGGVGCVVARLFLGGMASAIAGLRGRWSAEQNTFYRYVPQGPARQVVLHMELPKWASEWGQRIVDHMDQKEQGLVDVYDRDQYG